MPLTTDDRQQIAETLALHAYVFDENQLDRIDELFVREAVYDMSPLGMGVFEGSDAIRAAAEAMSAGGHAPTAHFVTNIVVTERSDETAPVRSRGLMIMADGGIRAVTHDDVVRHHDGRWLISRRVIAPVPSSSADPVPVR